MISFWPGAAKWREPLNLNVRLLTHASSALVQMLNRRKFVASLALTGPAHALAKQPSAKFNGRLQRIEQQVEGRLGVAIVDVYRNRRWNYRGNEVFPMCSTFKVIAIAALLERVDAGLESIDRRVVFGASDLVPYSPVSEHRLGDAGMTLSELCEAAITRSDNTAANLIVRALGGPTYVTAFAQKLGEQHTRLDRWEPQVNDAVPGDLQDTTTPVGMCNLLLRVVLGGQLTIDSRTRLSEWLVANKTGDTRLRSGLPKSWRIGDKTGTGEHGTSNDVSVAWRSHRKPWVIGVFITESTASPGRRNAAIAAVGEEVSTLAI